MNDSNLQHQTQPCLECGAAVDPKWYEQHAGHCHRCCFRIEQEAAVAYEAYHSETEMLQIAQAYLVNNQLKGYKLPASAVYTPVSRIIDADSGLWTVFIPFDFGEGGMMDPSGCFMLINDATGIVIDMPPVI